MHVEVGRVGVVVWLAIYENPLRVWRVYGEVGEAAVLAAVRLVEANEAAIRTTSERMHGQ